MRILFAPISIPLSFVTFFVNLAVSLLRTAIIFVLRLLGIQIVVPQIPPPLMPVKHSFTPSSRERGAPLMEIEGRQEGCMAFLLRLVRLNNRAFIHVTDQELRISNQAPFNTNHLMTSLSNVSTSYYSINKPAWRLYGAVLLPIGVIVASLFIGGVGLIIVIPAIIVSLYLILTYWTTSQVVIAFSTDSIDAISGFAFHNGFGARLTGRKIPNNDVERIFSRIDHEILRAHRLRGTRGTGQQRGRK